MDDSVKPVNSVLQDHCERVHGVSRSFLLDSWVRDWQAHQQHRTPILKLLECELALVWKYVILLSTS